METLLIISSFLLLLAATILLKEKKMNKKNQQIKDDWKIWANSLIKKEDEFFWPNEMRPITVADLYIISNLKSELYIDIVNGREVYICSFNKK